MNKTQILIVGAGPAGLSAAITLKNIQPQMEICVIDKAAEPGNHNLSGATVEPAALDMLLDGIKPGWKNSEQAKEIFAYKVEKDNVMFFAGSKLAFNIHPMLKLASMFKINFGQMKHNSDYIISISKLTKWLSAIAREMGIEVIYGFAAEDIIYDSTKNAATGIKLVDQGIDKHGNKQPNFVAGEIINADAIILAEGCDGLVTEKFIKKASLERRGKQLFSVGVKELIRVSDEQFAKFTNGRVVHAMGYPLWTPVLGPAMFGGGTMHPVSQNHIGVGMIVGLDWKYCDFNPQDALTNFKNHSFVKKFIEGGTIVEAGAKMIPEGGYFALPRAPQTNAIGRSNVLVLGDSAGLVNMIKIKGLHNAIKSGIAAGKAIAQSATNLIASASKYTELLNSMGVIDEMKLASRFRQNVAKLGPLFGMPLSVLGQKGPFFEVEEDYHIMSAREYKYKPAKNYDKDTFTAMAATQHREEQPSHLSIINRNICMQKCMPNFNAPCITFCPAGVYETVQDEVKPANPSNCLHCKTCQRKCPFDNIRWAVPEGSGGPRYKNM
ncbi:MAG: electron transfer flavoprotein [Planctomycetes bacterium GWF2_42_9]|nr:MAG: electron transfer flavoprotein [Planctomycetes bacterium GWF2_42_9]